jgi:hypothetical protein
MKIPRSQKPYARMFDLFRGSNFFSSLKSAAVIFFVCGIAHIHSLRAASVVGRTPQSQEKKGALISRG